MCQQAKTFWQDNWTEYANQFNVIKLNAVTFFQNADTIEEALNTLSQQVMHDMKREYSEIDFSVCKTLIGYCNEIYYVTKKLCRKYLVSGY